MNEVRTLRRWVVALVLLSTVLAILAISFFTAPEPKIVVVQAPAEVEELRRTRAALCVAMDELGRDSLGTIDRTACEDLAGATQEPPR